MSANKFNIGANKFVICVKQTDYIMQTYKFLFKMYIDITNIVC